MKIFGFLWYAHNQRRDGDKFASRSHKCIFVGYPYGKKGWKLYDLESKEYIVSRHVKFYEHEFPFVVQLDTTHSTPPIVSDIEYVADDTSWETYDASFGGGGASVILQDNGQMQLQGGLCEGFNGAAMAVDERVCGEEAPTHEVDGARVMVIQEGDVESGEQEVSVGREAIMIPEMGRGMRNKVLNTRLKDFVTHTIQKVKSSKSSSTQEHASGTPYPITYFISCERFSIRHRNFVAAVTAGKAPKFFK